MITSVYPVTATIRDFLENGEAGVNTVFHAWFRSLTRQVTLWTYPYSEGDRWWFRLAEKREDLCAFRRA